MRRSSPSRLLLPSASAPPVRGCAARAQRSRAPAYRFPRQSLTTTRGRWRSGMGGAGPGDRVRRRATVDRHGRDAGRQVAVGGALLQEPHARGRRLQRRQGARQRRRGQARPGRCAPATLRSTLPRIRRIVRVAALAERRGGGQRGGGALRGPHAAPAAARGSPGAARLPPARRGPSHQARAPPHRPPRRPVREVLRGAVALPRRPLATVWRSMVSGRPAGCGPQGRRCESAATPSL